MIKKAIIPAAGFGTRFLPITKSVPKEMIPIIDRPALDYIKEECLNSGITEIIFIISAGKEVIRDYFTTSDRVNNFLKAKSKLEELALLEEITAKCTFKFVYQNEQKGLGHAILQAEKEVAGEPFALLLGDDVYVSKVPAIKQLIEQYNKTKCSILGTLNVDPSDVSKFGICDLAEKVDDRLSLLKSVVEKPAHDVAPSTLAIGGRYVLTPRIFDYLHQEKVGVGNEIQLTDSILELMKEEKVYSYLLDSKRYDIGSKIGYLMATSDFALDRSDLSEDYKKYLKGLTI